MNVNYELPKETLNALKDALPHGAIKQIADSTGYSRNYVALVLDGGARINSDNERIISAARKILIDCENTSKKMVVKIMSAVNPVKES